MLTSSCAEDKNEELYLLPPLAPAWRETGQLFYQKGPASISSVYNV
jgi:hypothetical protein